MDIVATSLTIANLSACAALLRGRPAYPPGLQRKLVAIWTQLLRDDALWGCVVHATDDLAQERADLLGFAACVFVDETWFREAERGLAPYLTARALRPENQALPSPILRARAITRANDSGGLHVLNLHYGEAADLPLEAAVGLRYQVLSWYIENFRAYRIAAVLQELWGEIDPAIIVGSWGVLRSDYPGYPGSRGKLTTRPCLVGCSRAEAQAQPGNALAPLFAHTPPVIRFSPAEKTLLRCALPGATDAELAQTLQLSLATVKTQWRTVYRRVASTLPGLLPEVETHGAGTTARGQEKRRRLLEYLRRHPEELRAGIDERQASG